MPELLKPIKPLARSTNTYKFESKCWCEFILEKYFACKWLFQITNQFQTGVFLSNLLEGLDEITSK